MSYREKKNLEKSLWGASMQDLSRVSLWPAATGRHENRASLPQKSKF